MPIRKSAAPDTLVGLAPVDETELLPPAEVAPTGLAWGDDPEADDSIATRPWQQTWLWAALIVAASAVVAVAIAAIGTVIMAGGEPSVLSTRSSASSAVMAFPTSAVAAPTLLASPPPTAFTVPNNKDDAFLDALRRQQLTIYNASNALLGAQRICAGLAAGKPQDAVLRELRQANPLLTQKAAADYLTTSAVYYCPQYVGE